jgi:hypothetical protein
MPCHAMHPIQDLFLKSFSYVLQFDMHFICTPMWTKFYSCKKWVLHRATLVEQITPKPISSSAPEQTKPTAVDVVAPSASG